MFRTLASLILFGFLGVQAHADCRVMESRNAYLGYAQGFGVVGTSIRRLNNPYDKLAKGTAQAKAQAQELISRAAGELVQEGRASSSGAANFQELKERAGIDILAHAQAADLAVVYGSQRTRHDGALQLAYQTVDMRTGVTTGHVEIIPTNEARRLFTHICQGSGFLGQPCTAAEVVADPTGHSAIVKAALGAKIAHSLRCG